MEIEKEVNFLTPLSEIERMCELIGLDFDKITNSFNYGSHLHGSATKDSDYDLLLVADIEEEPLKFKSSRNDPYFYEHEKKSVEIDNKKYDLAIHSNKNFEKLLEVNYLMFIEPLFSKSQFRTICKIDYKKQYLEKWMTSKRLKKSLQIELHYSKSTYKWFKQKKLNYDLGGKWVVKKMFNCWRYHSSVLFFLFNLDFGDFGDLNSNKNSLLERYDKDGDECVDQLYNSIYQNIKTLLEKIKEIKDF